MSDPVPVLDVEVHLQNHEDSCGQACAQMLVRFLTSTLRPQQSYKSPNTELAGWTTNPEQLADMVNQRLAAGDQYAVRHAPGNAGFDSAMAYARAAIAANKPAIAMTIGGEHWILIRGFTPSGPASFTVHFWDPVPVLAPTVPNHPAPRPPNHAAADQCYGLNFEISGADECATWADWKVQFRQCAPKSGLWSNQFVMIVPASIAAPPPVAIAVAPIQQQPQTGPLLSLDRAAPLALHGLAQAGLMNRSNWAETIARVSNVSGTLRIDRLDENTSYFLVGLRTEGNHGILAGVDARTGELLFARLHPSRASVERLFTPLSALTDALPAGTTFSGRFVWAPNEATDYSRYQPLAELVSPQIAPRYLRLTDKQIVTADKMKSGGRDL